jgi:hypothetical protein
MALSAEEYIANHIAAKERVREAPEALPCPFCGYPGKKNNASLYPKGVSGHCSNTECPAYHINCSLEFWNTRAPNKEK